MANIHQVRVAWSGTLGGPGVSTFYFDGSAPPPLATLRTMFDAIKAYVPTAVVWTFPPTGSTVDSATGQATGAWTATAPSPVSGTGTGQYSRASGGIINWRTGVYAGGREIRGKTFIVPIIAGAYSTNGNLDGATVTALETAAQTFQTSATTFLIWSRAAAATATVTSATVPLPVAVLRSRRD